MRRTPLLPRKPTPDQLRRGSRLPAPQPIAWEVVTALRKPLPQKSANPSAIAASRAYERWSKRHRKAVGQCEVRSKVCQGRPDGIHHVIKRSQGGAKMPGPLADAQGQIFKVSCNPCNWYVEQDRQWAVEHGMVKSNPLRGQKVAI